MFDWDAYEKKRDELTDKYQTAFKAYRWLSNLADETENAKDSLFIRTLALRALDEHEKYFNECHELFRARVKLTA